MKIGQQTFTLYPRSGRVVRENPVPPRAVEERRQLTPGTAAAQAAVLSGVGRVDWKKVLAAKGKDIDAFEDRYDINSFLSQNAKTDKPRPTGNPGVIFGLALAPHFYPNILAQMHDDKQGLLDFDKRDFNSFDGETAAKVEQQTGVPRSDQLNFCVGSSPACRMTCLVYSGQNPATKEAPRAKMKLTWAFLSEPEMFVAGLYRELRKKGRNHRRKGLDFVVRLNMLSDIPWYRVCPELLLSMHDKDGRFAFFYDYTKVRFWDDPAYLEMQAAAEAQGIVAPGEPLLDLTFSFSGDNDKLCARALEAGVRIAAVFAPEDARRAASVAYRTSWSEILSARSADGKPFVKRTSSGPTVNLFGGTWPLVDGDQSDYRMDDPAPSIVALNFKQPSLTDLAEAEAEWARAMSSKKPPSEKKIAALQKKLQSAVPGIKGRTARGREEFTLKVPDPKGRGRAYAAAMQKEHWAQADVYGRDIEDVLAVEESPYAELAPDLFPSKLQILEEGSGEAAAAEAPMHGLRKVGTAPVLIGPHVPTVLND